MLFPLIHGAEDPVIQEILEQAHQDEKIDDLSNHCKPINQHRLSSNP